MYTHPDIIPRPRPQPVTDLLIKTCINCSDFHIPPSSTVEEIDRSETESQSTETGSSEKFERSMPRPVRLIYALTYALISQSQLFCYFLIVLNHVLSANIPSLFLPILVFLWAMLSVPRPTKTFWIFVITYTEVRKKPIFPFLVGKSSANMPSCFY